jgi:chemotaxis protein methyltransferase CheR
MDRVQGDREGDELTMMLDALSTNVTSFFREPQHFEYLARQFAPVVARAASGRAGRARLWSAGCSSGEEAYSMAMVLCEELGDAASFDLQILATDLSTRMLEAAAKGVYDADKVKDVPRALLMKYFKVAKVDGRTTCSVTPRARSAVTFARLNLLDRWPMKGPFDAIFCRNVMIYFTQDARRSIVDRFAGILAPGGLLFVGHSESLAGVTDKLEYVEPTIYRRR